MTKHFNLADNRIHRHNLPRKSLSRVSKALFRHSLAVICSGGLLLTQTACSGPFSSLDPQGPAAADVAMLWWLMFSFFSLVLMAVVILWHYAIKRRAENAPERAVNNWIIWGGLVLPTGSILALLLIGVPVGQKMIPLPKDNALQINITGHQWYWQVRYPGHEIQLMDTLHIPVDTVVHLHLTSADVIHSFWVPRLGVKLDLIPGRTNVLRLEASEPGIYRGQCAEYCGVGHAHMQFTVIAREQHDFASWLNTFRVSQLDLPEENTDD
ncbi:cytochrome c oxidase subunit II [Arsukibacterium sp.]|uniref:cytochrome c oxidase subunit II n=1 Tax=Arsukibacterium sp. TaxID=1977258 RepID=UPI00299ECEBE|nr:cytochrome c oxidase subunit II [Arsukibacterium sp.]MDX1677014.1 cytochrome c oxidase subunit II [Arsukibacterium sp.]